jgi:hypothetical protein
MLQALVSASRTEAARDTFIRWSEGLHDPDEVPVRYDPSVELTLRLAVGSDLVMKSSSRNETWFVLTRAGERLAQELDSLDGLMEQEKQFLAVVRGSLNKSGISRLLRVH